MWRWRTEGYKRYDYEVGHAIPLYLHTASTQSHRRLPEQEQYILCMCNKHKDKPCLWYMTLGLEGVILSKLPELQVLT